MKMFKVIGTDTYLKEISKWSNPEIAIAEKIPKQLAENPFVGQQLRYPFLREKISQERISQLHPFLREKRIKEKRVYYLIYEDLNLVLLVATSGKKDQQATIDHIISQFAEYRKVAEDIAKQVS